MALISAGQNASFEIQLDEKPGTITWLKDNKPLDDRLADRITTTELPGNYYRLEIKHCWYVEHLRHSYADNGVNFLIFSFAASLTVDCMWLKQAMDLIHRRVRHNLSSMKVSLHLNWFISDSFHCDSFSDSTETEEEKKSYAEQNTPYFAVRLKDTEIMENTFLRFMVKVIGEPRPKIEL